MGDRSTPSTAVVVPTPRRGSHRRKWVYPVARSPPALHLPSTLSLSATASKTIRSQIHSELGERCKFPLYITTRLPRHCPQQKHHATERRRRSSSSTANTHSPQRRWEQHGPVPPSHRSLNLGKSSGARTWPRQTRGATRGAPAIAQ